MSTDWPVKCSVFLQTSHQKVQRWLVYEFCMCNYFTLRDASH